MTDSNPATILMMSASSSIAGAEKVMLTIARHADTKKFRFLLLSQSPGDLSDAFIKAGGSVCFERMPAWRKGKNFVSRYLALLKIVKKLKDKNICVIHCNNYRLAPYAVWLSTILHVPAIAHIHDYLSQRLINRFCLKRLNGIIAVSRYSAKPFVGCADKVKVIYNGIDVKLFSNVQPAYLKEKFGLDNKKKLIGILATFTEKKRHELFLKIASRIHRLNKEICFVVAGSDVWGRSLSQQKLEELAQKLNIKEMVLFTGWRKDIPRVCKALDAIVVSSTSEPFPLVVLEAMAAETVVFAHKHAGGPSEQIEHDVSGFLVDCEDTSGTARIIVDALFDEKRCKRITQAARERVEKDFSLEPFIANVEHYYDHLLKENAHAR